VEFLHCWAMVLRQIFRQIVSFRVMTLINTNVGASRHIKREEVLLPVAVRHSKTPELNLNFIRGNENVTHSAQRETVFWGREFLFRVSEWTRRGGKCLFRGLQIFISRTADFRFADCGFAFRGLQILVSRAADFRFVSSHFVSQTTVSRTPRSSN